MIKLLVLLQLAHALLTPATNPAGCGAWGCTFGFADWVLIWHVENGIQLFRMFAQG